MNKFHGLTPSEVEASRRKHGTNVLTPPAQESLWRQFLDKFKDPLIIVICVAGVLSVAISVYEYSAGAGYEVFFEPVGIVMAVVLATGLSFIFELRANRAFAVLNRINDDEPVRVVRDGEVTEVPRRDIVVGDIVLLGAGDEVPADATLVESTQLTVDESSLTGEPLCAKSADPAEADPEATYASDRVLRGTKVMEGHGTARVSAVGDATENGLTMQATHIDNSVETPLDGQLRRLSRFISIVSYIIAGIVIAGRLFMFFHSGAGTDADWTRIVTFSLQTLMLAVALVCVSIPEGLPMAVTLSLAYSMRRMLRSNNLVRRLHACETMGAATVICTDKTGTLTQNRMQMDTARFFVPAADAATGVAVNCTAELDTSDAAHPVAVGNPTEGALLLWLASQGFDYRALRDSVSVVAELPFSTERKYMATTVDGADGRRLYVKGAPEIVTAMCVRTADGRPPEAVGEELRSMQARGLRTLAFAEARPAAGTTGIGPDGVDACEPVLTGIAGIADPVRTDVAAAIEECRGAGIEVKMVTGDTPVIAREIGRRAGLWRDDEETEGSVVTGPEFEAIPDDELPGRARGIKIIARARPLDKKRLVQTLQSLGEVVAVTGDGTNDAPALKAAHVGLSMGDGTAVAKEASDITIIDNSFASIARAVMWGRSLYLNIQRFILFQMTVNVAACLIVMAGAFMGTQSPLTVTQMLWVNLIMDTFAAMALASLPPSESVMADKPRCRDAFIITPAMWRFIVATGLVFFGVLLGLLYVFEHADITSLTQLTHLHIIGRHALTPYEQTLLFNIFVFMQVWNLFNARAYATHRSALHLGHCAEFLFILGLIVTGQVVIINFGGSFFSVTPLSASDWLIVVAGTSPVLWVGELYRAIVPRGTITH
ncbi:MAG: calcium-translocating P-type ATPase, PMCA-type [Muribaculaceae bacterium]|nr:calcium-translocating P-type ATPase, PMCA-type [Muribaculaceae bacterium]